MNDLLTGVYRHYKGPLYLVLGYGHDADADKWFDAHEERWFPDGERTVVIYVGLQLDDAHTGARLAVRTAEWFFEGVCPLPECPRYGTEVDGPFDACVRCKSAPVQRFTYVGPTWEG